MTMDRTMATPAARHVIRRTTLSERADELEERMMHELGERIATKSVLFGLADGKIEMQSSPALRAANPDKWLRGMNRLQQRIETGGTQ